MNEFDFIQWETKVNKIGILKNKNQPNLYKVAHRFNMELSALLRGDEPKLNV